MEEEILTQDDLVSEGLEEYSKEKCCVFIRPAEDDNINGIEDVLLKLGFGDVKPETFGYIARTFPDEKKAREHFESLDFSPQDIYYCLYIDGKFEEEN
jgi:hypothetical protein